MGGRYVAFQISDQKAQTCALPIYVLRHVARLAERSGAVGARVVLALLVRRAHVPIAIAWFAEGAIAARASVRALAFLGGLLHHGALAE